MIYAEISEKASRERSGFISCNRFRYAVIWMFCSRKLIAVSPAVDVQKLVAGHLLNRCMDNRK